jgi:arginine repressor
MVKDIVSSVMEVAAVAVVFTTHGNASRLAHAMEDKAKLPRPVMDE